MRVDPNDPGQHFITESPVDLDGYRILALYHFKDEIWKVHCIKRVGGGVESRIIITHTEHLPYPPDRSLYYKPASNTEFLAYTKSVEALLQPPVNMQAAKIGDLDLAQAPTASPLNRKRPSRHGQLNENLTPEPDAPEGPGSADASRQHGRNMEISDPLVAKMLLVIEQISHLDDVNQDPRALKKGPVMARDLIRKIKEG